MNKIKVGDLVECINASGYEYKKRYEHPREHQLILGGIYEVSYWADNEHSCCGLKGTKSEVGYWVKERFRKWYGKHETWNGEFIIQIQYREHHV